MVSSQTVYKRSTDIGRNWDPSESSRNQDLYPSLNKARNQTKEWDSPLLKNLSWSLLPTIIKEPLPPSLSLLCLAASR